jgi:hypothetical protein
MGRLRLLALSPADGQTRWTRGWAQDERDERFCLSRELGIHDERLYVAGCDGLRAVWHAPLFVYGLYTMPPAVYAVSVLALSVALTWYYNTTDGWVLGAILFHGSVNTFLNLPPQVVGGEDGLSSLPVPYFGVVAVVVSGLGGILLLRYGRETLTDGDVVGRTWTDRGPASNTNSTGEGERGRSHAAEG